MPTDGGWIIGRIQVNGSDDLPAVAAIQQPLNATPPSACGGTYTPPENTDLHQDRPVGQEIAAYIHNLAPQQYRDLYYTAQPHNQPRPEDADLLTEPAGSGWTPDTKLDLGALPDSDRKTWEDAWPKALSQVEVEFNLMLRLYRPGTTIIDGTWTPPGITAI